MHKLKRYFEKIQRHQQTAEKLNRTPGKLNPQAQALRDLCFQVAEEDLACTTDFNIALQFEQLRHRFSREYMVFIKRQFCDGVSFDYGHSLFCFRLFGGHVCYFPCTCRMLQAIFQLIQNVETESPVLKELRVGTGFKRYTIVDSPFGFASTDFEADRFIWRRF